MTGNKNFGSSCTTRPPVPLPAGATDVTDWTDVGSPDEFRCFDGPIRTVEGIKCWDGWPATVFVNGTQLRDGTVEGRCIRVYGVHGDDMLSSETARVLGRALLAAADDLDRLEG